MSLKETLQAELDRLEALAEELDLKAHLAKADAKDELESLWEKAEEARLRLSMELDRIKEGAEEPAHDIAEAAKGLAAEVKTGYEKMRSLLKG